MIARCVCTAHDRVMNAWRLFPVLVALLTLFASGAPAQDHIAIPEQACEDVRIDLVPLTQGRGMGLRVTNVDPGDFTAHLQSSIVVEQEIGGRWQRVGVAGLLLRTRCEDTPDTCISLTRDSSITVVPWDGMLGDAQCVCTRCAPAPAGRYRFVIQSCHCQHPRTAYSAPFALAPST